MSISHEQFLAGSEATEALGAALARCSVPGMIIHLLGDLGAGKTTLVRGFLHGLGHQGAVKSPTYTLVEHYDLRGGRYYHFDLYRLGSPEELEYLGIRDYFDGTAVALVEWPQRGAGMLPEADLSLQLDYKEEGRKVHITSFTSLGDVVVACLAQTQKS